ncbi:MAG: hypothetical protein J3Q66DRAFT_402300 [Benniella sp.]|nr:MAG: hypothetical protein J3Q66DRAFT_402300 [Benniella sp.]
MHPPTSHSASAGTVSRESANSPSLEQRNATGRKTGYRTLYKYQMMSVEYVNNLANKAIMFNIHYFFATNYILDLTAKKIPGLNAKTFQIIKDGYTVEPVELSADESDLCLSLARELSRSGDIEPQVVPLLYRKVSPTLKEQEDTVGHTTVDPFWSQVFHRDSDYVFGWADEVDEGSRVRRGDGLKSEGHLKRLDTCLCVMEIKSPKQAHNGRQQLEDLWKLVYCVRITSANHRAVRQMAAVQVFEQTDVGFCLAWNFSGLWSGISTT